MVQLPPARNREEQLATLIALMYRSAAEPELWTTFLDRLGVLFRANFTNVGLVTQPTQAWWFDQPESLIQEEQDVNVVFQQGLSAEALHELASRWLVHDGFTMRAVQQLTQRGLSGGYDRREVLSDAEFDRLPFCHEFALPHDYYHTLSGFLLGESRDLGLFLNIHRPRRYGPFEADETACFHALLPYLQQALRVHQHWRALRQQIRSRALALDAVDQPCLTVDVRGRVLWSNLAAEAFFNQGDGLGVRGGVVTAAEPAEQAALLTALRRCAQPGRGFQPQSGESLSLTRRRAAQPLRVTLLRVPPEDREGRAGSEVLLLLNGPERERLPTAQHLEQLYHLTPAESRVALLLARGMTAQHIAEEGHVSVGTVRNQLKQVLSKTNTHRQSALVRLLLSLPEFR